MKKTHRDIEEESMRPNKNLMTDAERQAIKAKGVPTQEQYDARYASLLDRYKITPNDKTAVDKNNGAVTYQMDEKAVSQKIAQSAKSTPVAEKAEDTTKKRPSTTAKKPTNSGNRNVDTSRNTKPIEGKPSTKAHTPVDEVTSAKAAGPTHRDIEDKSMQGIAVPARKLTISDKLSIKQAELRAKENENFGKEPRKGLTLADIRREYQTQLMKKHKKELNALN